MAIDLFGGGGGGGTPLGGVVELSDAYANVVEIDGMTFMRSGFIAESGFDPSLAQLAAVPSVWSFTPFNIASLGLVRGVAGANNTWVAAGGYSRLARSVDDGLTWSLIIVVPSTSPGGVATDGNGVWVCSGAGSDVVGFRRSIDDGVTWTSPTGLPTTTTQGVGGGQTITTDKNGTWLGCYSHAASNLMYRSTDNGASWALSSSGITANQVLEAVVMNQTGVCLTTRLGNNSTSFFVSTNSGASWTTRSRPQSGVAASIFVNAAGNLFVCFTDKTLWRSNDLGVTWFSIPSFAALGVTANRLEEDENGAITAACEGGKVAYSGDGGDTWRVFNTAETGDLQSIAYNPNTKTWFGSGPINGLRSPYGVGISSLNPFHYIRIA